MCWYLNSKDSIQMYSEYDRKFLNILYRKFSKNSASLIIRHLHYNEIISLKKFGTYNTLV